MRILFISQYYPPEDVPIPASLSRGLAERGHQVRVLTGYPNYPSGVLHDGVRQRWRMSESIDGMAVLRVPLYIDHSQSAGKRALNYGSFAMTSATALSYARGADVIYVYATQMTAAFGPWLWSWLGGPPYVLHVQDLWPDSIVGSSLIRRSRTRRLVERFLAPWLSSVYKRASAVIGIAPTMIETLAGRGVDRRVLHLVYNWSAETRSSAPRPESGRLARDGTTTVLYAGNVGDMQDLETAVVAAAQTQDAGIRLRILGDGVALDRLKDLACRLDAENVEFLGRVPSDMMDSYYQDTDYSLISLKDLPAFRGTIPSKLQSSMAHGLPIITSVQGDVRAMVEESGVGFTSDAESVESLEQAFREAAATRGSASQDMARRARQVYADRFSQDAAIDSIERVLIVAAGGDEVSRRRSRGIRRRAHND